MQCWADHALFLAPLALGFETFFFGLVGLAGEPPELAGALALPPGPLDLGAADLMVLGSERGGN